MKKGVIFGIVPFLIGLVSAYGEQAGQFIAGFYIDTNMLAAAVIFVLFFWGIAFGTKKLSLFHSETARIIISLILSLFGVYGLAKAGISFENFFGNLGIMFIIQEYAPHIITVIAIICMFIWNIGVVLMVGGLILTTLGIVGSTNPDLIYNWGILIAIGITVFVIGLAINKKIMKKVKLRKMATGIGKGIGKLRRRSEVPVQNMSNPKISKERTRRDLQRKYDHYSNLIKKIMNDNNGIIPGFDKNSPTPGAGWERHRYIQALKAIENIADKQGIKIIHERWYESAMRNASKRAAKVQRGIKKDIQNTFSKTKNLVKKTNDLINLSKTNLQKLYSNSMNLVSNQVNKIEDYKTNKKRKKKEKQFDKLNVIAIEKRVKRYNKKINELTKDYNSLMWELKRHEQYAAKGVESSVKKIQEINSKIVEIDDKLLKLNNKISENTF